MSGVVNIVGAIVLMGEYGALYVRLIKHSQINFKSFLYHFIYFIVLVSKHIQIIYPENIIDFLLKLINNHNLLATA